MRSPFFFLSLHIYIYNTIYIRNFYFVILSIFFISFISFSISTNSPNITILALLNLCFSISFIHLLPFLLIFPFYTIFIIKFALYKYSISVKCLISFCSIHILCQNSLIFLLFLSLFRHYTYTNNLL